MDKSKVVSLRYCEHVLLVIYADNVFVCAEAFIWDIIHNIVNNPLQGQFFWVLSGSAPIEISHKNVTTLLNCTAAIQLQVSDQEHDCDGDIFNSTVQKIRGYYEVTCVSD